MLRKHHLNVINVFTANTYFLSAKLQRFSLITQHTAAVLNVSVTTSGGSFTLSDETQLMICQRIYFYPPPPPPANEMVDLQRYQAESTPIENSPQTKAAFYNIIIIEVIALQIIVTHLPIWIN